MWLDNRSPGYFSHFWAQQYKRGSEPLHMIWLKGKRNKWIGWGKAWTENGLRGKREAAFWFQSVPADCGPQ